MGSGWRARLPVAIAALWWGSLTTTGFVVVPLLFAHLPSASLAGQMAARLFTAQTWMAVACALLLMLMSRPKDDAQGMGSAGGALPYIVGGVLLALLAEFAVAPRIVARDNLRLWHSAGSAMYLLQWLCAGAVLWKVTGPQGPSSRA
jgi:hypothetical protein